MGHGHQVGPVSVPREGAAPAGTRGHAMRATGRRPTHEGRRRRPRRRHRRGMRASGLEFTKEGQVGQRGATQEYGDTL
ncbi:hypothetical protein A0H81_02899 [Grifola frondosa]|uniref:Uncharacterized protein n=1 Tax=Grifola frondosa TaxID=5627 RepID=A0A1C7MLT1_GRIFR|nr:hypothetical protein A0H81_02899 [Grifola frondosa]